MREIAFLKVSHLMDASPPIFSAKDTVSDFLGHLYKSASYEAIVVFKNRIGLVTALDVIDTMHPERTLLGNVAKRAPSLNHRKTVLDAVELMISNRLRALPVVKNGRVIGMISSTNILEAMRDSSVLEDIMCRDVMKPAEFSVRMDEKISTARSIMCRHDINHVLVVDGKNRLSGVITARDIVSVFVQLERSVTQGEFIGESIRIWDALVKELMDSNPLIVEKEDNLKDVVTGFKKLRTDVCIVETTGKFNIITPMEIIALLLKYKTGKMLEIRVIGLPFSSDFLDMKTISDKIIRVIGRGSVFHKDIREIIIDVKQRKRKGKRIYYQIIARIYSSTKPLIVSAHGWYLAEAISRLRDKIDRVLRKSKGKRVR